MLDGNHVWQLFIVGICAAFVLFFSTMSIMFDFIEFLASFCRKSRNWNKFHSQRKDRLCSSSYYRTCQFLFSTTSLSYVLLLVWKMIFDIDLLASIDGLLLITASLASAPSFLYFVQLLPVIGNLVIGIQRMLFTMLSFMGLTSLYSLPFTHAFLALLKDETNCEVEGFETLVGSSYTTFKVMLNMVDLSTYQAKGKEIKKAKGFRHIVQHKVSQHVTLRT